MAQTEEDLKRGRSFTKAGLVKAGDTPEMAALLKPLVPVTRAGEKLVEAADAISANPDAVERAFMVRQLVLCTLPHSDPGGVEAWTRQTATAYLVIQPGWDPDNHRSFGYPYGSIPRLLLFWMTTEVQLRKRMAGLTPEERRTLYLGRRLADFMRRLNLNPASGGKRGDAQRLHNQMERLLAARIGFHQSTVLEDEGSEQVRRRREMLEIAPKSELWWDPRRPEQGALFQSRIILGEDFAKALEDLSAVPLDMRALRALKRSPLALDLYAWVCYKAYIIVKKNQFPQFVPWETLRQQLGTDYDDPKNFKRKVQGAFRKIVPLYPGLTIKAAQGGFDIHATRLAVPQAESEENPLDHRSFPR